MHGGVPQHIKLYFLDLASGAEWTDDDLEHDLRIDTGSMRHDEARKVWDAVREIADGIKAHRKAGHFGKARSTAHAGAAVVANMVGEAIKPTPKDRSEDQFGPRDLAAKIRRQ